MGCFILAWVALSKPIVVTLQGTNISPNLGKGKASWKVPLGGEMLVPRRLHQQSSLWDDWHRTPSQNFSPWQWCPHHWVWFFWELSAGRPKSLSVIQSSNCGGCEEGGEMWFFDVRKILFRPQKVVFVSLVLSERIGRKGRVYSPAPQNNGTWATITIFWIHPNRMIQDFLESRYFHLLDADFCRFLHGRHTVNPQDIGVVEEPDLRVEPDRFPSPRPEAVGVFFCFFFAVCVPVGDIFSYMKLWKTWESPTGSWFM